jgi:ketosteroid isomerase-like protein
MSDIEQRLAALEQEVSNLRAIQDIQQLRFEYWYSLADKDVDRLMDCFTEDVFLDYGFSIEMTGRETVREFFGNLLGSEDLIRQVPRGSNPQITILSDTEAEGRWLVEVNALRESQQDGRRIGVQYFEKYRKTDAGWKLYAMKNDYLGFESFTRRDGP